MNGEEVDIISILSKDLLVRNKFFVFKIVKSVLRSKISVSESSVFEEVEVFGEGDEILFVESIVGVESIVENIIEVGVEVVDIDGVVDVLLVEEGDDFVVGFEVSDVFVNSEDGVGVI